MLEFWGDLGFIIFTVSTTLFTIMYLTLSRWYKSFMGSLIAMFMIGVVILALYLTLRIWGVEVPGVEWVRLVIFWILGLGMATACVGFLEIQFGNGAQRFRKRLARKYSDVKDVRENYKERS